MNMNREDIYTRVTNQIVQAIEAGAPEFRMPWHAGEADCFSPINAVSTRPYRGVNVLTLWVAAAVKCYESGLWATYKQWLELGAQVRKGEQGSTVVLWKPADRSKGDAGMEKENDDQQTRRGLLVRGFSVFNATQVDGYTFLNQPKLSEACRIRAAEQVLFGVGAAIQHSGGKAYYNCTSDCIHLPRFDSFRDAVSYYATLAHELTHWTGAEHRLNRELTGRFESNAYAAEELIAELGAAFLCAQLKLSVEPRPDHARYIVDWLRLLRNDKRAIFSAAAKAQQAADWLLDRSGINISVSGAVDAS